MRKFNVFYSSKIVDPSTGKKIRGQKCEVKDYDQFVFDIYAKYVPQPVDIKTQQVMCNFVFSSLNSQL